MPERRPTKAFREHHADLKEDLAHLETMLGGLPSASATEQRGTMARVLKFLKEHILPHAAMEERVLHPVVDRRGAGPEPVTGSMRYEHRIIERRIDELVREAGRSLRELPAGW